MKRSPAQIIAWAFIPAALILGAVAVLNFALVGRVTEDLVAARNTEMAHILAAQIKTRLDQLAEPLRTLAAELTDNPAEQAALLTNLRDEFWDLDAGVLVLDQRRQVTATDERRRELVGVDWSGVDIRFPEAVFPVVTASNVLPVGQQNHNAVALIVPLRPDGIVIGLLSISQEHARISDFYHELKSLLIQSSGTTFLIDANGFVFYHPDTWQIGTSKQLEPGLSQGRFVSTVEVPGTEWRLVIEEEWSALIAASDPYRWLLLLLLVLGLLLPAAVVWVALKNVQLYARAEADAAAAERNRLARELHDAVSQTLSATNLIAGVLPRLWERDPDEARRQLVQLRDLTAGAQAEMRTLLLELRPEALAETPLPDLLGHLLKGVAGREMLSVSSHIDTDCNPPLDVKIALYRIAQEALNNIARHADAQTVTLKLHCTDAICLTIHDEGCGFDPACVPPDRLGQRSMRERADAIGARLSVESAPGQGTTVQVVCRTFAQGRKETFP